ncbi:hypothetical protein M3Y95_01140600 [Aphelenchoides besseyi]|nr:hypothetical protein M3Y95_01140600 [Aphelenchoides besseyi]
MTERTITDPIELHFAVASLFGLIACDKKSLAVNSQGSRIQNQSESNAKLSKRSQSHPRSRMKNIQSAVQPELVTSKKKIQKTESEVLIIFKLKNKKNTIRKDEVDERKSITCLDSDDKMKFKTTHTPAKFTDEFDRFLNYKAVE